MPQSARERGVSAAEVSAPTWTLARRGAASELLLAGDWLARRSGLRPAQDARRIIDDVGAATLRIDCCELGQWDSALVTFLRGVIDQARERGVRVDNDGVPQAARQLLALAGDSGAAANAFRARPG